MSEPKYFFSEEHSASREALPTIFIIFGASGDLTKRKLIPAIYNLAYDNLLPECFQIIGVGRSSISHEAFQKQTKDNISTFSRRTLDCDAWSHILEKIRFCTGDYSDPKTYVRIKQFIDEACAGVNQKFQLLFYISTPPSTFLDIIKNLSSSELALLGEEAPRLIIEKPFGHDLASAKELNHTLRQNFKEEQIFRIDHYLGKETVQDILVQRFANSIFEPIWNFKYVSHVEITVAESLGVGGRGGYYDQSGVLRDMLQNHLMQLLALVAMEPPSSTDPEDIRNEKVKVLKSIQPIRVEQPNADIVRGQYIAGVVNDESVCAYIDEAGIAKDSFTETYAGLRLKINNWRWYGVPFYIRSGKRMHRQVSEIAVHFRAAPSRLFGEDLRHNSLVIQLQPNEGTTLLLNSKVPGLETRLQPIKMHFEYAATFGSNTPEAYERLILDAITGDSTLFIRGDEAEASWELFTPVLDYWKSMGGHGLHSYEAGSWGPTAAQELLFQNGHAWRKP